MLNLKKVRESEKVHTQICQLNLNGMKVTRVTISVKPPHGSDNDVSYKMNCQSNFNEMKVTRVTISMKP